MHGGKRRLGARSARAAQLGVATALAGLVATVIIAFAPSSRASRASAEGVAATTAARVTVAPQTTAAPRPRTTPARVAVFGDSLTVQAGRALVELGRAHGLAVSVTAYYGLAPCDYAARVRQAIASRPDVLVLAFSGNNLTPCMQPAGSPLTGSAYFARYRSDLDALVALASADGVPVELVAPPAFPPERDSPSRSQLVVEYARLAFDHPGVTLVKTAAALGGPAYATSLPCLAGETAALGCRDGRIVVRNASRIHFDDARAAPCPVVPGPCSYSAGAHRYAAAIIGGLSRFGRLGYRSAPATVGVPLDGPPPG